MSGWTDASTETLHDTRTQLLAGIAKVHQHIIAGTANVIPEGRSSSPAEAGFITWILLEGVEAELIRRKAL